MKGALALSRFRRAGLVEALGTFTCTGDEPLADRKAPTILGW
jgi:hypothetical protein